MRGKIRSHAGIDDANRHIAGGGEGIGAGAAGQIGHHHRDRHGGGILRHAFFGEAMVGGEHQQHGLVAAWRIGMPDHAKLHGQILDPPQRSRRLGLAIDTPAHFGGECRIERRNRRRLPKFLQIGRHRVPFSRALT